MAVKQYLLSQEGERYLTPDFRVGDFAPAEGAELVLVDEALAALLQRLRDALRRPVALIAAYQAPGQQSIGEAEPAWGHSTGQAADLIVEGLPLLEAARCAEVLQAGGIGLYDDHLHVDTREERLRWDARSGRVSNLETFAAGSAGQATPAGANVTGIAAVGGGLAAELYVGEL